ncbi:MAG TPA: hypothetical protein VE262_24885 [Blastocatellia bacterium]|nr:hypothetical protein [Blastocatellia bacterium]
MSASTPRATPSHTRRFESTDVCGPTTSAFFSPGVQTFDSSPIMVSPSGSVNFARPQCPSNTATTCQLTTAAKKMNAPPR